MRPRLGVHSPPPALAGLAHLNGIHIIEVKHVVEWAYRAGVRLPSIPLRLQIKQFIALAVLTALEAIRQPICLLLTTTGIVFVTLMPVLIMHTMGEAQKVIQDSALAFQFVCGLLLGGYAASAALGHEIRHGTVASILSKPVGRELFFLAKFCGVTLLLLLYALGMTVATLLSARMTTDAYQLDWWVGVPLFVAPAVTFALAGLINYYTRRPFVSNAFGLLILAMVIIFVATGFVDAQGNVVPWGTMVPWRILPAIVLVTMAIIILAAVAVALTTRLETVPTLAVCSVLFLLGLMSDYLLGRHVAQSKLAAVAYGLIPNWQHFWVVDALTNEGAIPWSYVLQTGVYAAFYLSGVLGLGILAFRRIEIKV